MLLNRYVLPSLDRSDRQHAKAVLSASSFLAGAELSLDRVVPWPPLLRRPGSGSLARLGRTVQGRCSSSAEREPLVSSRSLSDRTLRADDGRLHHETQALDHRWMGSVLSSAVPPFADLALGARVSPSVRLKSRFPTSTDQADGDFVITDMRTGDSASITCSRSSSSVRQRREHAFTRS